jgi:glutaredoxin
LTSVLYINSVAKKQQCFLAAIYGSWVLLVGGAAVLIAVGWYAVAVGCVLGLPLAQWLYVRNIRRLSPWMGYGEIGDEPAAAASHAPMAVTLYTALGCPFCPVMEQRLAILGREMGFELRKIDVTIKPALLAAKGIRSVPVVEIGGTLLVGAVTTRQLAEAIGENQMEVTRT